MPLVLTAGLGAGSHGRSPPIGERHKHTCPAQYGDTTESSHVLWTFHLQTAREGEMETERFSGPVD